MFENIESEVTLHMFTKKDHCLLCNETLSLVEQVAAQSDKVILDHCECDIDSEKAQLWKIERHPAIVVEGQAKGLIRFYGIPSGYEFGSLIESIIMSSKSDGVDLDPELIEEIQAIDKPLHLQVFVTPTCPYCPTAVLTAFKLAMLNENIIADMVEATEFQELSMKYHVQGVPKTIINDDWDVVGGVPAQTLMDKVREALA
jgi:glutaredoxin-like protein